MGNIFWHVLYVVSYVSLGFALFMAILATAFVQPGYYWNLLQIWIVVAIIYYVLWKSDQKKRA